jgi:hypothetical protein
MTEAEHARKARGDGDRTRGPYRPSRREQITYVSFSPDNVEKTGDSPRPVASLLSPSPRPLLPDPNHVSGRVAEGRHPQIAFWIRSPHYLAAASNDLLERLIDLLDEDIRLYACFAGNGQVRHEVPDDMPSAVLETRVVAISVYPPAEHAFKEGR